jgi:hypothetical protein
MTYEGGILLLTFSQHESCTRQNVNGSTTKGTSGVQSVQFILGVGGVICLMMAIGSGNECWLGS